ncbi:MAG: acyl-CoA synthetase [Chloroflexota bacterium]
MSVSEVKRGGIQGTEADGASSPSGRVWRSELTPVAFLERSANVYRARTALIDGERAYSYAELGERVYRLASALREHEVRAGDRVAILASNCAPMVEAHYAVPITGAIMVPMNIRLAPSEMAYILQHSGACIVLAGVEFADVVTQAMQELDKRIKTVWVPPVPDSVQLPESASTDDVAYEEFVNNGSPEPFPALLSPDEGEDATISLNYTSGTTGRPKGVMVHYRGAYLNALGELMTAGLTTESVYLWTLPMFHCNGWSFPWAVVAAGGTQVCLRAFDAGTAWTLVRKHGVTHLCGAPTVLTALATHPAAEEKLSCPLRILTAAAPPSPTIIGRMESLGCTVVHVYGLTEVYGPHTVSAWQPEWNDLSNEDRARLKSRQGVAYVIADPIRVVDDDMQDVPADGQTMGEVVMRGNNVMKGYYRDPEATERAFRGGWFHSGDLGVMHPDGYIELRDRAKDVIISGGENISTIEVEQTILQHPDVLECAVIGVPDPKWGETPKAFVTLCPGAELATDTLIEFCRSRIARFKAPRYVEFGELPKTSTGKVQKYVLREREWAGHERRIH